MSIINTLISKNDIACEYALLLYMAYESKYIDIPDNAFYNTATRAVYTSIKEQYNKFGKVELTALDEKTRNFVFEMQDYHYPKDINILKNKIMDFYNLRSACMIIYKAFRGMDEKTIYDKLSDITAGFSSIATGSVKDYNHERSVYEFMEHCKQLKDSDHQLLGISSGLDHIDTMLGGWQKGKTYIVGGMEKLGKSRFCAYLTSQWAKNKIGGIWFSMEMSENDIHECVLSNRSIVNSQRIGSPDINDYDFNKVVKNAGNYKDEPLHISTESNVNPEFIREKIKSQKVIWAKKGFSVVYVVVDYIQRMVSGDKQAMQLEDTAKKLADIARDENVIMIVISQLSQAAESNRDNLSPHQFIKGSKGIREAADAILVLYKHKKDTEDMEDAKDISLYVVQRKGVSNKAVLLRVQLQYCGFKEL